jgi:hypothetical protein
MIMRKNALIKTTRLKMQNTHRTASQPNREDRRTAATQELQRNFGRVNKEQTTQRISSRRESQLLV